MEENMKKLIDACQALIDCWEIYAASPSTKADPTGSPELCWVRHFLDPGVGDRVRAAEKAIADLKKEITHDES